MSVNTIAFLAGLGLGNKQRQEDERRKAREDERDQWARDDRAAMLEERTRARTDRETLRAAAAPIPVEEVPLDGPTPDGTAIAPGYKAGAAGFASRGLAEQSAADQRRERVGVALDQIDPAGMESRRTSRLQGNVAEMQFKKATEEMVREGMLDVFSAAYSGASSDQVMQLFNKNGKQKLKSLQVTPFEYDDPQIGKVRSAKLVGQMEDGTPFQVDDAFRQGTQLFGAAKQFDLLRQLGKDKRDGDHQKKMESIAQQNADTQEQYRRDQAENMRQQRIAQNAQLKLMEEKLKAGAKPGQPLEVTLKDKREFETDLSKIIDDQFPVKEGGTPEERKALTEQKAGLLALGSAIFQTNAQIGTPLTAGTAGEAIKLAQDPKNHKIVDVGGQKFRAVVVHGVPVIVSQPLQAKPQQPPAAPGAAPIQAPPVVPGSGPAAMAAQGVQAPAAQPTITAEKTATMAPLNAAVERASAALAAAAKSNDPAALQLYQQALERARAARLQEAVKQFGQQQAQQYLATLPV